MVERVLSDPQITKPECLGALRDPDHCRHIYRLWRTVRQRRAKRDFVFQGHTARLFLGLYGLNLLDQLDLRPIRRFEEADSSAGIRIGRHLFENAHAIVFEPGHCAGIIVGVERDMLDAIMLLMLLAADQRRNVERQAVQIYAITAAGYLGVNFAPRLST